MALGAAWVFLLVFVNETLVKGCGAMTLRPYAMALLGAGALLASPALAQNNRPIDGMVEHFSAGPPPAAGPMQGGLGHDAWFNECARRLDSHPGMDHRLTADTCQSWWAFYQAGGAPHPTYGYAIPVNVTTEECTERTVERRVYTRRIIRPARHHYHSKLIRD